MIIHCKNFTAFNLGFKKYGLSKHKPKYYLAFVIQSTAYHKKYFSYLNLESESMSNKFFRSYISITPLTI